MSEEAEENIPEVVVGNLLLHSQDIPFAHFTHYSSLESVLKVIIQEWNLQTPKIMLTMVSDCEGLGGWPDFRQQEEFVKGLIKASNATSMWIFTNGLNIGIPKAIGDAFQADYTSRCAQLCYGRSVNKIKVGRTPLIGICRDAVLTYHDKFKTQNKGIALQNTGNILDEQKFDLNPFHTHFLIMEDKTNNKRGVSRFLLRMEDEFRNCHEGDDLHFLPTSPVPVIAVLVQGNLNSVHFILSHLKRKLPILIVRGSGGLADILSYAYYEVHRSSLKIKDMEYVENVLKQSLGDQITAVFPSLKDNKIAHSLLCSRIMECIQWAEPPELRYITVFNMRDLSFRAEDLPDHLLETIFKSLKSDASTYHELLKRDLLLTIDWNCPELAETKVFFKDPSFKVENDVFEQTLLSKDREKFISMFLDHGFEVQKYTSAARVVTLFEKVLLEDFFREVCWEGVLGYRKIMMLDDYFIDSDFNWIIENLIGMPIFISSTELNECSMGIYPAECPKDIAPTIAKRKSLTVLIIWALVSNRGELAFCLNQHIDNPIRTALICSLILDKMKMYITDEMLKEETQVLRQKFADMAVGVFDLCYNDMPSKAYEALNTKFKEWGAQSVMDLAALAQNKHLVAHPCCQKWLTNTFMGKIKIRDLTWGFITFPVYIKVILCAFFVFPMYLWMRFKDPSADDFSGSTEYEANDPYYLPDDKIMKERKRSIIHSEMGRTHLLKYHYPQLHEMIFSMWSAPITKFWVSHIFYAIYLAIFSLAVIWTSCGNIYLDYLICVWTSLIALDSAHVLYSLRKAFPTTPLFGTSLEIVYILLFVIFTYFLRIQPMKDPYGGKVLMCLGLIFFYYRMIFMYLPISSTLGPLLYRVKEMVSVDFVNFMKLVVLILIANAIAMQAVLYPDYPFKVEMIRMSFHKAFIAFFMTPVDELKGTEENCITFEQRPHAGTMCRVSDYVDGKCSSGTYFWPYVIVFQYMLLLKLILLTILFALFSNTGQKLGAESNILWKLQRYHLVIRYSVALRLPPPLNIFSVIGMLYNFAQCLFKRCVPGDIDEDYETKSHLGYSRPFESNYWRQLAQKYYANNDIKKYEDEYIKREVDIIDKLSEDVNFKENMIYRARSQIAQLESDISYTHAHLETLKYLEKKEDEHKVGLTLHILSRESPYPRTKIQRFPVPNKYVPWEVMWLHYDPSIYTMPQTDFQSQLRPYADPDYLRIKLDDDEAKNENATYLWNMESVDNSGVYCNRKSWLTDSRGKPLTYRLGVDNLPYNPMGRTGLKGKGALPRWGPNHHTFVVITKWRKKARGSDHSLLGADNMLELVMCWHLSKKKLSLPGGFAWSESRYSVIQSVFLMTDSDEAWSSSSDMIRFFREYSSSSSADTDGLESFQHEKIYCGYMDDQLNTDQAWKEVELWHIHYGGWSTIERAFKANVKWRILSEDIFIRLPYGQTNLLQECIRKMNAQDSAGKS